MNKSLIYVMGGLVLGIILGTLSFYALPDQETAAEFSKYMSLVSGIFVSLIKMVIGPIVLTTLIIGIRHMGNALTVGRIGAKAFAWFFSASVVSLLLGLLMANILRPGAGAVLADPNIKLANLVRQPFSLENFVDHLVPTSVFKALAEGEILQILVFAIFAGVALVALGEHGKTLNALADEVSHLMHTITVYVMKLAPIAVFASAASVIAKSGPGILIVFSQLLGGFYLTLAIFWLLLVAVGYLLLGTRIFDLIKRMREPFLLGFSTASSEAAYPGILYQIERFGVSDKFASFVLPLGYSFNLDGSMIYMIFATLFIAQSYGIDMPISTQLIMVATLMITSKGIAGVPRASLIVVLATLKQFGIPDDGLLLIFGVDQFMDMGRSATNVIGNSLAVAAVAKFEGALRPGHESGHH